MGDDNHGGNAGSRARDLLLPDDVGKDTREGV